MVKWNKRNKVIFKGSIQRQRANSTNQNFKKQSKIRWSVQLLRTSSVAPVVHCGKKWRSPEDYHTECSTLQSSIIKSFNLSPIVIFQNLSLRRVQQQWRPNAFWFCRVTDHQFLPSAVAMKGSASGSRLGVAGNPKLAHCLAARKFNVSARRKNQSNDYLQPSLRI